jgi:hypothetical protein
MASNKACSAGDQITVAEISASTKFCHISAAVEVYVRLFRNQVIKLCIPVGIRAYDVFRWDASIQLTAADVAG